MKTIIAGSRTMTNMDIVKRAIDMSGFMITEVVCGGAKGVDTLGRKWAGNGILIPVKMFPANWNKHGKIAGSLRNIEMAKYADALIAIWDMKSNGTKHMISVAKKKGLKVFVYDYKKLFTFTKI